MWNLFKEVFRSLKSVKVTILGLGLLVYLSSSVFIMLSSVREQYTEKFDDYNAISNLHDLTYDLDINNDGQMADGGYTNGIDLNSNGIIEENEKDIDLFRDEASKDFAKSIKVSGFKGLDSFGDVFAANGEMIVSETIEDSATGDTVRNNVFDSADLVQMYNKFKTDSLHGRPTDVQFDINAGTFTPRRKDLIIPRYQVTEKANSQVNVKKMQVTHELKAGDTINFDASIGTNPTISTIGLYNINTSGTRYQTYKPTKDIYINIKTKIATINSNIGAQWIAEGTGFIVPADVSSDVNVGKNLLGLYDGAHYDIVNGYHMHNLLTSKGNKLDIVNAALLANPNRVSNEKWGGGWLTSSSWGFTDQGNQVLNKTFKYPASMEERTISSDVEPAVFVKDKSYKIPSEWIKDIRRSIYFKRHNFNITYNFRKDEFGNVILPNWTGSYLEYMDSLTEEEANDLKGFSYWTKIIVSEDPTDGLGVVESTSTMLHDDVDKLKVRQVENTTLNSPTIGDVKSLRDAMDMKHYQAGDINAGPENNGDDFLWEFREKTNTNKRSEYLSIINTGATNITRQNVRQTITDLVGEENIGRRQTVTTTSFDYTQNKNQVFQFVNVDSSINKNVDKMYYEQKTPTELLTLDSTKVFNENWAIKNTPTPSFSIAIINAIYDGYFISDEYYSVDVKFAPTSRSNGKDEKMVLLRSSDPNDILSIIKNTNEDSYTLFEYDITNKIWNVSDRNTNGKINTSQLSLLLGNIARPYTVKGTVGKHGSWYKVMPKNSNIVIPVQYRNMPAHAIEQAVKDEEYTALLNPVQSVLNGILTVGEKPWMSAEVLDNLMYAANLSMKNNHFHTVMKSGIATKEILGKIGFETFYYANLSYASTGDPDPLVNRLFTEIIDHMESLIDVYPTIEEQREFFASEFESIKKLFKHAFNFSFGDAFNIEKYLAYVSDFNVFFQGLKSLIYSIDAGVWFEEIKKWYDLNYGNGLEPMPIKIYQADGTYTYERDELGRLVYPYFGTRELLTPLFGKNAKGERTIDSVQFAKGISEIINSLDFDVLINELIDGITKGLNEKDKAAVAKVFTEMNASRNGEKPYQNIADAISDLVRITAREIDPVTGDTGITRIMDNVLGYFDSRVHYYKPIVNGEVKVFKTSYVTNQEMFASVAKGIFSDEARHDELVLIIIKGFNLSYAVETVNANFQAPTKEDGKLDLMELQSLETLSYQKIEDLDTNVRAFVNAPNVQRVSNEIFEKVYKAINKYYGTAFNASSSREAVKKYAVKFMNILDTMNLKTYGEEHLKTKSKFNPTIKNSGVFLNEENPIAGKSLADLALWTLKGKDYTDEKQGQIVDDPLVQAYVAVADTVEASMFSSGASAAVIYSMYLRIIESHMIHELKDISSPTQLQITAAFEKSLDLVKAIVDFSQSTDVKNKLLRGDPHATNETARGEFVPIDDGGTKDKPVQSTISSNYVIKSLLNPIDYIGTLYELMQNDENLMSKFNDNSLDFYEKNKEEFTQQVAMLTWSTYNYVVEVKVKVLITWITINQTIKQGTKRFNQAINILATKDASINPLYSILDGGYENFKALANISKELNMQSNIFSSLGISATVASTFSGTIFPMVAKGATVSMNRSDAKGNVAYALETQLRNLGKEDLNWFKGQAESMMDEEMLGFQVESHGNIPLSMDMYYLNSLSDKMGEESNGMVFDLNLKETFDGVLGAATEIVTEESYIRFLNVGAYVAKVSETYMLKNNKRAYTQKLPESIEEINALINSLPNDQIMNINNQKFIILGKETAADYMFPVLDAANINVDTTNQALVFVNQYGFDRVIQANQGLAISDYLVLKKGAYNGATFHADTGDLISTSQKQQMVENGEGDKIKSFDGSTSSLRDALNFYSSAKQLSTFQKAYLASEVDPLNPERAARIQTVQGVIESVSQLQFYGVLFLMTLVGLITIFISQRYIDNRRVVIGILRAQGYNRGKIALSFILFALFTALIGGTTGYITGYFLQAPMMGTFETYWAVPTDVSGFSWWEMLMTVLVPFIGMSVIIFATTLHLLREKPTALMSGASEASTKKYVRVLLYPFKKFSIITRFRSILAFNSLFKMLSLTLAMTFTFVVGMFSVSSQGVFNEAVYTTYAQKEYRYSMDLFTPTIEGQGYDVVDRHAIETLEQLYIPFGLNEEGIMLRNDYFRPGPSSIMDLDGKQTQPGRAHIMSKASMELSVAAGGLSMSPWQIARNAMPDSQYVTALQIAADNAKRMEQTQEHFGQPGYNYFDYIEKPDNDGYFVWMKWNEATLRHDEQEITTSSKNNSRAEFKEFLFKSYQREDVKDYMMIYGGVDIEEETDEMYTYADVVFPKLTSSKFNIMGIDTTRESNQINAVDDKGTNLNAKLRNYMSQVTVEDKASGKFGSKNQPVPIVVNEVVARKHQVWENDIIYGNVKNSTDRFASQINGYGYKVDDIAFKVIGVSASYINDEILSTQDAMNHITNLDRINWRTGVKPFNGVFTKHSAPGQAIESLLLYSKSGYWGAAEGIDVTVLNKKQMIMVVESIFKPAAEGEEATSVMAYANGEDGRLFSNNKIDEFIRDATNGKFTDESKSQFEQLMPSHNGSYLEDRIDQADLEALIRKYNLIYGATLYDSSVVAVGAQDITSGFVKNLTTTVDSITLAFIIITITTSIIVLIVLSTMIVNENKKKIATFTVMGYTEREKIRMFLYVYVPFVLIAIALAIPMAFGLVAGFNKLVLVTANMALPLALGWSHILVAIAIISVVFIMTTSIAYAMIRRIKAIYVLQGDD